MQRFQPVLNKFKNAFFDGNDSDAEVANAPKPRAAAGRGRGGKTVGSSQSSGRATAPAKAPQKTKRAAVAPINEACLGESEEEVKGPQQKRRRIVAKE